MLAGETRKLPIKVEVEDHKANVIEGCIAQIKGNQKVLTEDQVQ